MLPGLVFLSLLALRRKPNLETIKALLKIVALGMVLSVPAVLLIKALKGMLVVEGVRFPVVYFAFFILVAGPVEEVLKFLIVWTEAYDRWQLKDEQDGIVYAAASSLGFGVYENLATLEQSGLGILAPQAWVCVLVHVCFSVIFGYYLGLAKAKKYNPSPCIAEGLVLVTAFNGLHSFITFQWPGAYYPAAMGLLIYTVLLAADFLVPYASLVAPKFMACPHLEDPSEAFRERSFPILTQPELRGRIAEVLKCLGDRSDEVRLRGLKLAGILRDQRIYKKVRDLTHDPVKRVRDEAIEVHEDMTRSLGPG